MTFGTSFGLALLLGLAVWQISARISKRPTAVVAQAQTVAATVAPVVAASPEPVAAQHTPAAEVAPTFNEGVALYEAGKADDAAVVLARVVDADPKFADAWLMLGLARFDSNDTVGAHDAATRAAELDPKSGRVHMLLASIFMDEKDRAKADDELKKYLELEPKGEFSAEAQQLLAKP
jgi:Flp pilus assembly protein TadD